MLFLARAQLKDCCCCVTSFPLKLDWRAIHLHQAFCSLPSPRYVRTNFACLSFALSPMVLWPLQCNRALSTCVCRAHGFQHLFANKWTAWSPASVLLCAQGCSSVTAACRERDAGQAGAVPPWSWKLGVKAKQSSISSLKLSVSLSLWMSFSSFPDVSLCYRFMNSEKQLLLHLKQN